MINSVLGKFMNEIRSNVQLEGRNATVSFVKPGGEEDTLHSNAINVALFGSQQERNIVGVSTYKSAATEMKPPMRLTLDLVLLFNISKYAEALDAYTMVMKYFYENDLLNVPYDGYENEVQVLISEFNDKDEIALLDSYDVQGMPMLRYKLKYLAL